MSSETYEIFHDSYFAPFDDDAKAYQNNLILTEELRLKNSSFIILQLLKGYNIILNFPRNQKQCRIVAVPRIKLFATFRMFNAFNKLH